MFAGMLYIGLISLISVSTCAVQLFVLLEEYALQNPRIDQVPRMLRFLLPRAPVKQKKASGSADIDKSLYQVWTVGNCCFMAFIRNGENDKFVALIGGSE